MPRYRIVHRTHHAYARQVEIGPQRLMVRPKDSHDLRLEHATLTLSPAGTTRWTHDVFGNSIAMVTFAAPSDTMTIVSDLRVSRDPIPEFLIAPEPSAATWPFIYFPDDRRNLWPFLDCRYAQASDISRWTSGIVSAGMPVMDALRALNAEIRSGFAYGQRYEPGVQSPSETLAIRTGTCRDFATLFIEASRALGIAARFVTGYLYDPSLDAKNGESVDGAGATHAWAEVYLPGPGWVEFDPTNGLIEAPSLLRVGVSSDADSAIPVSGSYMGTPQDLLATEIEVKVTALPPRGAASTNGASGRAAESNGSVKAIGAAAAAGGD